MKSEKLVKKSEKFRRCLLIYLRGYRTGCNYTLDEWFEARDYVNANKHLIPKFK
jgi:hypothetical protein